MRRCFGYMAAASLLLGSFALTGSLRAAAEETETIAVEGERSAAEEVTSIADTDEIGGSGSAAEGAKPAAGDTGEASENAAGTADSLPKGISSLELTRLMGNGTNLGNTMEACDNGYRGGNTTDDISYYETLWGQPVTTSGMLQGMKDAGFDTVRIPVAWMTNATHLNEGDYTISEAYLDRVEEIVNYALDADMFVIVNDHWDGGWYGMFGSESEETRELAMEAYRGMWEQITARFRDYDGRLIFEGANEEIGPRFDEDSPLYCQDSIVSYLNDDERYKLANEVNQAFVDTVRAAGGENENRFLLIPGYGTNIEQTCDSRFVMPIDSAEDKLLISVHFYSPWSYCGASSAAGATRFGTKKDFEAVDAELKRMTKFTAQGIGVVIGEYGALPGADGAMKENCLAYHRYFLDCCDRYDYANCLWDTSGFFVRENLEFADEGLKELYAARRQANEPADYEAVREAAALSMEEAVAAAPESFTENAVTVDDDTCLAWIMWSSGDWGISYSVGDEYNPDSITPGVAATDALIEAEGEGTYTVGLDFTGTEAGYSSGVAFAAVGITNGELLHPGWAVHVKEVLINGEPYALTARPYTTSDDGKCTRFNIFNEWVTSLPEDARVLYGPNIGISPVTIDRNDSCFAQVESIEITFVYGPKK